MGWDGVGWGGLGVIPSCSEIVHASIDTVPYTYLDYIDVCLYIFMHSLRRGRINPLLMKYVCSWPWRSAKQEYSAKFLGHLRGDGPWFMHVYANVILLNDDNCRG